MHAFNDGESHEHKARPVRSVAKSNSSSSEEDVAPSSEDESEILERVLATSSKALSGCLPYFLVVILFIVLLYVLALIFQHSEKKKCDVLSQ
jgi:hypothetical protein